jgi:hypothetical protein
MGAIYVSLVSLALGQRPVHGTIAFGEVSNATHFTSNWMLDKVLLTQLSSRRPGLGSVYLWFMSARQGVCVCTMV